MLNEITKLAEKTFFDNYGYMPSMAVVAPGRVNLIGEHTDYNDGFVFPMTIPLYTVIVGDKGRDNNGKCRITTTSENVDQPRSIVFDINNLSDASLPRWSSYLRGVVAFHPSAAQLLPFDAVVASNVPVGGGLSSSAAFEAASFLFINMLTSTNYDQFTLETMATVCQKAEHIYAGVPCGIMDQFICLGGQKGSAMLLDCRSLESEFVPLNDPEISFLVIDSKVKHNLGTSEYPVRREQCFKAAKALGVKSLRDADLKMLEDQKQLMGAICYKRARHVISEIDRCRIGSAALKTKNYSEFGRQMIESHKSLKDDYEVSCTELDQLVEIVSVVEGVYGCRMTGGGFGGCVVALLKTQVVNMAIEKVKAHYNGRAEFFICTPEAGAHILYNTNRTLSS